MSGTRYLLHVKPGCSDCAACHGLLKGWPHDFSDGVELGRWALEYNETVIDQLIDACPLDLIELSEVSQ